MPPSKKSRSLLAGITPRNRRYIMLGVAALCALGTWNLINSELSKDPRVVFKEVVKEVEVVKEEVKIIAPKPDVEILVAAKDLPAGNLVNAKMLDWKSWPYSEDLEKTYAVKGKISIEDLSGAVVRQGFRAGEAIVPGRLVKPGERGFLAAVLNPGYRAVSVPINSVTGIAGFIFPGDRVDVILTHTVTDAERTVSETVLRDIRVLAIDQQSSDQLSAPSPAKIVTIEVTPKQVERVMVMLQLGKLSLALRGLSPQDVQKQVMALMQEQTDEEIEPAVVSLDETLARNEEIPEGQYSWDSDVSRFIPAPKPSAAAMMSVQVFRADKSKKLSFSKNGQGGMDLEEEKEEEIVLKVADQRGIVQ